MRYLWAVLLVVLLVAPAGAEQAWNVVVTPNGSSLYWLPALAYFEPTPNASVGISVGPTDGVSLNLGRPAAPWATVYATGYTVGGQDGLTVNVTAGNCVLRFRGGLLVAVTGGTFWQPCATP